MYPVLQFGPFVLRTDGLTFLLGLFALIILTRQEVKRFSIAPERVDDLAFFAFLAGVVGARLGHVLYYWPFYQANPGAIFSLSPDAWLLPSGVLVALVVILVYLRRQQLSPWTFADAAAPGLALAAAFLALGSLLAGSTLGEPTSLPWAIEGRHPVAAYSLITTAFIFVVIFLAGDDHVPGRRCLWLVILLALSGVYLDTARLEGPMAFGLKVLPFFDAGIVVAGLIVLERRYRTVPSAN